jgi:hypothetical protein
MKGKECMNNLMDNPSVECDQKTMVIVTYRDNFKKLALCPICSIILQKECTGGKMWASFFSTVLLFSFFLSLSLISV